MRGQEEGGAGEKWGMQPLSGLHRASDGYLGTVSRGQSGQGSAATAATIVKPEPQALGAGPFAAHGCYSVPGCAQHMAAPAVAMNYCGSRTPAGGFTPYYGSPGSAFSRTAINILDVQHGAAGGGLQCGAASSVGAACSPCAANLFSPPDRDAAVDGRCGQQHTPTNLSTFSSALRRA